ncbi:MAG: capsule assembly Wzi family protein, partial [Desulfuromonadales bacterium]|nr:capsule assembly Wzi family protein [Desulfuromonadales bacterium]
MMFQFQSFKPWPTFLVFLLIAALPSPGYALPPTAPVALDSWVYPALNRLAALGLVESSLQGSRPYSRREAARQVNEARGKIENESQNRAVVESFRRLRREFAAELKMIEDGVTLRSYFKPLRSLEVGYIYQEGVPSQIPAKRFGGGVSRISAQQFSLNTNNDGLDYSEHSNVSLSLETEARLGPLLLYWHPLLLAGEDEGELELTTLQGLAVLGLGPVDISVGRQSLWWGQGRHGSLVLTNNAQPLDMVRITNPVPVLLPWVFKILGPIRFDIFWSQLEEDRVIPEPYLAGLRLNFKPIPWLELGASRTVMFGGEGRPDVDAKDFFTILTGKNLDGDEDTSNNLAALDLRLKIPFLWDAELYSELGGEDEAGGFISNKAYLGGLYLPRIEPSGRLSLRLEYAHLSHIDDNSPMWYRHGIYQSGYTYKRKILGHHAGGGTRDYFTEIEAWLSLQWVASLGLDYERRGEDQPIREKHFQPFCSLRWSGASGLSAEARYAYDRV